MIIGKISSIQQQMPNHFGLNIVADFVAKNKHLALDVGKHHVSNGVYAFVDEYQTAPSFEKKLEAHEKNIDVQILLSGHEVMELRVHRGEHPVIDELEEKDLAFYAEEQEGQIRMDESLFAVFFPEDLHKPGVGSGNPVKKVVFKVPVNG